MKRPGERSKPRRKGSEESASIPELLSDTKRIEAVLRRAVREALLEHKRLGNPIAVERDGKAVEISPEEIPVSS